MRPAGSVRGVAVDSARGRGREARRGQRRGGADGRRPRRAAEGARGLALALVAAGGSAPTTATAAAPSRPVLRSPFYLGRGSDPTSEFLHFTSSHRHGELEDQS